MSNRVVVFGSGGQLGVELCRVFEGRGWSVKRFDRQMLDITDPQAVEAGLAQADPHLVINSAAYNQVDVAESEPLAAFQANALAVRNIAMACRQVDAQLVHFSTDYVFDEPRALLTSKPIRPTHWVPMRFRNWAASCMPRHTWIIRWWFGPRAFMDPAGYLHHAATSWS